MGATNRVMGELARWCAASGWLSQKVIAAELGVSDALLSRWKIAPDDGGRQMPLDRLVELLALFVGRGEAHRAAELAQVALEPIGLVVRLPDHAVELDEDDVDARVRDAGEAVDDLERATRRALADGVLDDDERARLLHLVRDAARRLDAVHALLRQESP